MNLNCLKLSFEFYLELYKIRITLIIVFEKVVEMDVFIVLIVCNQIVIIV